MSRLKGWKEMRKAGLVEPASSLAVKTGDWKVFKPVVDHKKCIKCFRCVVFCPDLCIEMKNEKITSSTCPTQKNLLPCAIKKSLMKPKTTARCAYCCVSTEWSGWC